MVNAYEVAEKVTSLLNEYGIRVPEDIEAEVGELIEREYAEPFTGWSVDMTDPLR